jgi:hypothetical protein
MAFCGVWTVVENATRGPSIANPKPGSPVHHGVASSAPVASLATKSFYSRSRASVVLRSAARPRMTSALDQSSIFSRATAFMQYRSPLGSGPSGNT